MEVTFDIKGIGIVEAMFNGKEITQAVTRSLNRAANAGKVAGTRKIREEYNIKAKDIKKTIKIKKASYGTLEAKIAIEGKPIPLKYFGARQTSKGVTIKIKKKEPRKLIKRAFIGGYVPKRVNGRLRMVKVSGWGGGHVYIRKPGERRKPFKMTTEHINIPDLFSYEPINDVVMSRISEVFEKEFWHNYEFYLAREK